MKHNAYVRFKDRQQGLTLMELMIAMLIGVLLLLGITSMFMSNKRVYKEQEYMSRLQENARFALDILLYDIRMAGYTGCSEDITSVSNHLNGTTDPKALLSFSNAVEGSESKGHWLPSDSTEIVSDTDPVHTTSASKMVAGTDGISIRYLDPSGIQIAEEMPQPSAELKVTKLGNLKEGDMIAVSDCNSADIMQLTQTQLTAGIGHLQHNTGDVDPPPGNATQALQKRYSTDAEIVSFISRRYYIGNGSGKGPSLYRMDNGGTPLELIEGVEQMQILYGLDTDGNKIADTYVNAANVGAGNWGNIVSVRLALLFRTSDSNNQIDKDTGSYSLLGAGGTTVSAPNDYYRRRVFTTTIQIRNRSV